MFLQKHALEFPNPWGTASVRFNGRETSEGRETIPGMLFFSVVSWKSRLDGKVGETEEPLG